MSLQQCRDRADGEMVRSRLGDALQRLQQGVERSRRDEARVESLFQAWQKQWSSRRELIAHRLEVIETQLKRLTPKDDAKNRQPQLVVFGVPHDADEMSSIVIS